MAATGLAAQQRARAAPRSDDEVAAIAHLLPIARRERIAEQWWQDGCYHCRYDRHAAALTALHDVQRQQYGHFSLAALLAAPISGSNILHDTSGHEVHRRDYPGLFTTTMTIGDVLRVEREGPHHVRFQCCAHAWPLSPPLATAFRKLCDVVVHNYPAVLQAHNELNELQPRPPTHAIWRIVRDASTNLLQQEPVPGTYVTLGPVRTRQEAARLARTVEPLVCRFDEHPLLDAFARLWTATTDHTERSAPPVSSATAVGLREVVSRTRQALTADAKIGPALATVSWHRVARLPASESRQRLLLHKIKGLRLSGWDRTQERRGCPHCPAPASGDDSGHTFHIVWHCHAAQLLWDDLRDGWARLGVLGCLQRIWAWRNGVADAVHPWTATLARSALRGSFRAAFHTVGSHSTASGEHATAIRGLLNGLQKLQRADDPPPPLGPAATTDRFLLFFDGGSRGNPGPGGAGSVIVRTNAFGDHPHIQWVAAMSLASRTTTNNQAEYFGLITGLKYATRQQLRPLTVIGDSAMAVAQMRHHKAPKSPALRTLYGQARFFADVLQVADWRHHYRSSNKMADAAANLAMDSRRSVQTLFPTDRAGWSVIATHLTGDVEQWQASTHPGPD